MREDRRTVDVTWKCDRCNFSVTAAAIIGEDLWYPNGMKMCRDAKGHHLLCNVCEKKWLDACNKAHPETVWIA